MFRKIDESKIVKMYLAGESALTIEKKTKVSYKTVYRILERNGVGRRDNSEKTINAFLKGRMKHSKLPEIARKNWLGNNNPRFKNVGSKRFSHEYILIKTLHGWVNEERDIASKCLNRPLSMNETIHHINGKKDDNRPENLYLMTRAEHKAWHVLDNLRKKSGVDIRPKLISNLKNKN